MSEREVEPLAGVVFDETTEITFVELCRICAVDSSTLQALIAEGILEPSGGTEDTQRFAYSCVRRTRTAVRLQRDLGVNLPGAALALELLQQIETLRDELGRRR